MLFERVFGHVDIRCHILCRESGGGNLCLTLALKSLREGRPELLDGSFCQCPQVLQRSGYLVFEIDFYLKLIFI